MVEPWDWDGAVVVSCTVGIGLSIYALAKHMLAYAQMKPASFPSNTWHLHIAMWFGAAMTFVTVMKYMVQHCSLQNYYHAAAFFSGPLALSFSCMFVLSLNSLIIYKTGCKVGEEILLFLALFLTLLLPVIHSNFKEVLWHAKTCTFLYVYQMCSATFCLQTWRCSGHGRVLFLTTAVCWFAWTCTLCAFGPTTNGPLLVFTAWTLICYVLHSACKCIGDPEGDRPPRNGVTGTVTTMIVPCKHGIKPCLKKQTAVVDSPRPPPPENGQELMLFRQFVANCFARLTFRR
uniref:Protein E2 n=1 Tax=Elephant endotheliotropic herpesvirus 1A TaxID=759753 RepID=A0A866VT66_ELHV1|nr:protein E2 [Elephant endotheliotropic herpesvirus 1A]